MTHLFSRQVSLPGKSSVTAIWNPFDPPKTQDLSSSSISLTIKVARNFRKESILDNDLSIDSRMWILKRKLKKFQPKGQS